MINLKSFVAAIHDAIISASNTLMDKNEALIDKYFVDKTHFEATGQKNQSDTSEPAKDDSSKTSEQDVHVPKCVILEYPVLQSDGKIVPTEIQVPLITLVPLGLSQIEKATITAEFEMALVDDELQLSFPSKKSGGLFQKSPANTTNGKLEIVISPQDTPEGLRLIVEAYEAALKRQIS
jgi:hypothetical protein